MKDEVMTSHPLYKAAGRTPALQRHPLRGSARISWYEGGER